MSNNGSNAAEIPGPSCATPAAREKRRYKDIAGECYAIEDGYVWCKIDPGGYCKYRQKKDRYESGNFIRHLRTEHEELAKARGLSKDDVEGPLKKRKITKRMVAIDRQALLESAIKLVTVHHLPISFVEWDGMKILLDPICDATKVTLNRHNLQNHLRVCSDKVRKLISEEMKNKIICLKIDSASKHGRHILGINAQYMDQNRVVIRTLGMIEVRERQTAKFLKSKIEELLKSYNIQLEQILTITVDNGANMIATVKQLQKQVVAQNLPDFEDEDDANEEARNSLIDSVILEFSNSISLLRCAVHTMQLAVTDVMKHCDADIRSITSVAKHCRRIAFKSVFDLHGKRQPQLFSPTRWGGVYVLLNHFASNESFYKELAEQYAELDLTNSWEFIHLYTEAFKPLYICTLEMQAKHVCLSDFYFMWLWTIMEVSRISNNKYAQPLVESLTNRLQSLKSNMVFKAALLLDPRFNYMNSSLFTADEKEETRKYITSVWDRISKLKQSGRPSVTNAHEPDVEKPDRPDDMDSFLTRMFGGSLPNVEAESSSVLFAQQLSAIDLEPHKTAGYNVWNHWVGRAHSHPELVEVAMVILAAPSNQVSVERAFSAMGLVFSDMRTQMTDETLDNILIIKLNKELIPKALPILYDWKEDVDLDKSATEECIA